MKKDLAGLREERDRLKRELEREEEARSAAESSLETEKKKVDKSRRGDDAESSQRVSELEASLERERGKAAKYKGWLEKMTETVCVCVCLVCVCVCVCVVYERECVYCVCTYVHTHLRTCTTIGEGERQGCQALVVGKEND